MIRINVTNNLEELPRLAKRAFVASAARSAQRLNRAQLAERSGEENYTVINNVRGEGPNLGRCLINIIKAEINVSFQWIKFPLDS